MLNKTLLSIVSVLNNHSIPYMVICGYAVLYHGHAHFTEDIDIVLGIDANHLNSVIEAVSGKFLPRPKNPEQFVRQTNVLPLLEKDDKIRVDLIFSFLEFERNAIAHSDSALVDEQTVNIVRAEDLIVYKILASRPRDLDDIQSILNQKKKKLDTVQITSNIKHLSNALADDSLIERWEKIHSDFSN